MGAGDSLVCRPRAANAPTATRHEFLTLVAKLGARSEVARELAYRLYTVCERKKRATEALAYNGLVQSWPEIARLAREGSGAAAPAQAELL